MAQLMAGPIGLLGFALATILLNLANATAFPLNSMNLSMGIALGAGLQIAAAVMAAIQKQFILTMAFFGYGFFWLSFVFIFTLPSPVPGPNGVALGLYLFCWMLFSMGMTVCVWRPKSSVAVRFLFITVVVLFGLLALSDFLAAAGEEVRAKMCKIVAGAEGIVCGLTALYVCMAEAINNVYERSVLPLGEIEPSSRQQRSRHVSLKDVQTDGGHKRLSDSDNSDDQHRHSHYEHDHQHDHSDKHSDSKKFFNFKRIRAHSCTIAQLPGNLFARTKKVNIF